MANFAVMMQKAQKMKQRMGEMQEQLGDLVCDGETGGGVVKATVNGKFELKSIKIDPSVVNADDVEMLEDLVLAAVNDARTKAQQSVEEETQKIMSELGLPPGMGLPF